MLINPSLTEYHFVPDDVFYIVTAFTLSFFLLHFGLFLPLYRSFAHTKNICISSAAGSNEDVKCSHCTWNL